MAIEREPIGHLIWQIAKRELRTSLKLGGLIFAVMVIFFLARGFATERALLLGALFFIAALAVVGIDLPQELKRATGYPSFRTVNWRVYAFAMAWFGAVFASMESILLFVSGSGFWPSSGIALIFGLMFGALSAAIPAKRS